MNFVLGLTNLPRSTEQISYYFCSNCNKKYLRKVTLNRHLKWECGKEPRFCCNFCNHRFTYKADFDKHLLRKHFTIS